MEKMEARQMKIVSTFNAPIDLVWEVWSNQMHIAQWWGPKGFNSTIHKMDLHEGGEWNLTLHGPDGTNFPNRSIFKEIRPKEKIVFEHFNPHFITTVKFKAKDRETEIDWSMLFDSVAQYQLIVKVHKADEGQKQNIEKLAHYLKSLVS